MHYFDLLSLLCRLLTGDFFYSNPAVAGNLQSYCAKKYPKKGNGTRKDSKSNSLLLFIFQGVEFLYYPATNTCLTHYPDQFTGWCYGPYVGQFLVANVIIAGGASSVWKSATKDMTWVSQDENCWPVSMQYLSDSYNFFNATLGIKNPSSVFKVPSSCVIPPSYMKSVHKTTTRSFSSEFFDK